VPVSAILRQDSLFKVAAVASRWQRAEDFIGSGFELQISRPSLVDILPFVYLVDRSFIIARHKQIHRNYIKIFCKYLYHHSA